MPAPSAGYSALKRLGEMLMRESERDPRLACAVEKGYDLLNPVVHGAGSDGLAAGKPRPFYATSYPELALEYTAGGRNYGVGSPAKGGVMIPAVLKGAVRDTRLSAKDTLPLDDLSWLRELGIEDPEAFRQRVWELNSKRLLEDPLYSQLMKDNGMTVDNVFGSSFIRGDAPSERKLHQILDALEPGLASEVPLLRFGHTYNDRVISPKGRVLSKPNVLQGDAVLVADPSLARSPWAAFEEDGLGLMKKRGGLVQYSETL